MTTDTIAIADLSPEVLDFAAHMQARLDANAHRGDWKDNGKGLSSLWLERGTQLAIHRMRNGDLQAAAEQCADVANLALILAHAIRRDLTPATERDPRVDPRPGDVLRRSDWSAVHRVLSMNEDYLKVESTESGIAMLWSFGPWREYAATLTVLHRAED